MNEILHLFPDYFSEQAVNNINKYGKETELSVYRVSKYGNMNTAFLNYYDEIIQGLKKVRPEKKEALLKKYRNDVDSLSVSCYYEKKDIMYYFDVTLKNTFPEKKLLYGKTTFSCGLTQITSERKPQKKDSHVDWWLYNKATPWKFFREVKKDD
ncbi:MAG: hypothetical protein SOU16_01395 [Faecalimonas sp.]|nr:hypothetical protein [Faecalimonas sp.]